MGRKLQGSKRKLAYFVLQILSLAIALTRQVQEVGDLQGEIIIFESTVTNGKFIRNSNFVRGSDDVYRGSGENCLLQACQGSSCCPRIEECIASCEAGLCYEAICSDEDVNVIFFCESNDITTCFKAMYINSIQGTLLTESFEFRKVRKDVPKITFIPKDVPSDVPNLILPIDAIVYSIVAAIVIALVLLTLFCYWCYRKSNWLRDATDHENDPISIATGRQTDMQAAHQESQSLLHSNESPTSQSQKTLSGPDSDCASVNDDPRIVMNEQGYAQPRPALPIILSSNTDKVSEDNKPSHNNQGYIQNVICEPWETVVEVVITSVSDDNPPDEELAVYLGVHRAYQDWQNHNPSKTRPVRVRHLLDVWKGRQSNENQLCAKLIELLKDRIDCNLLVSRLKPLVNDEEGLVAIANKH